MRFPLVTVLAVAVLLLLATGCGDNITIVEQADGPSGVIQGDIDPGMGEFTITIETAGSPGNLIEGPFIIHGSNIRYDTRVGALIVDITVTNASPNTYPLPVWLEFETLLPPGVTIQNPSNDIFGPGAIIAFSFTNRDLEWSPGETSQPYPVMFEVDEGVSIGFGARLHVASPPARGAITGMVFADMNEDGVHDPAESGLAGRGIRLAHADSLYDCTQNQDCIIIERTTTNITGEYGFYGLRPGYYVVTIERDRCSTLTTPGDIYVVLVEWNGGVTTFSYADFGVLPLRTCCGLINGHFADGDNDWVNVNSGPGLGSRVEEIIAIDGRDHVLHLDSRAGGNYYLFRTQLISSCGVLDHSLVWDWKLDQLQRSYGLAAVFVEFFDGAHARVGAYFVRRHSGNYWAYECDELVAENSETRPTQIVGCEQVITTSFDWITSRIDFTPEFFAAMTGPDINPDTIAEIKVWIESYNNAGAGVDAYFDDFRYVYNGPEVAGR